MDIIDKKILCLLDMDCRTPIARLAKMLRIHRNVVAYRIQKLEKTGVIEKYICSVNLGKLGFTSYKINIQTTKSSGMDAAHLKKYLVAHPAIVHLIKTTGKFDYSITVAVRNIHELDTFISELKENFGALLRDYYISLVVQAKVCKLQKLLLEEKFSQLKFEKHYSGAQVHIDEKDKQLLKVLSQQANLPLINLAKKAGMTTDMAKYRLRKLTGSVINSFRVMFDFSKLGWFHYIILLRIRSGSLKEEERLFMWCMLNKKVLYCTKRIGYYDFTINIAIQTIDELNNFLAQLNEEFGNIIDAQESIVNSELLKLNYFPF